MTNFKENKSKIAFIGDRLLTDVFQANKCGGMAILTKPIPGPKDNAHSQRLRFLEEEFYNWVCPKDIGFETHDSHWVSAEELKKLLIKPRKGRDR
jgi:predicted HAD superfamily phosphohydrolase YqeG